MKKLIFLIALVFMVVGCQSVFAEINFKQEAITDNGYVITLDKTFSLCSCGEYKCHNTRMYLAGFISDEEMKENNIEFVKIPSHSKWCRICKHWGCDNKLHKLFWEDIPFPHSYLPLTMYGMRREKVVEPKRNNFKRGYDIEFVLYGYGFIYSNEDVSEIFNQYEGLGNKNIDDLKKSALESLPPKSEAEFYSIIKAEIKEFFEDYVHKDEYKEYWFTL